MPELPEVETIRQGLAKTLPTQKILAVELSGKPLRFPILPSLPLVLIGQTIVSIQRRGRYLLLEIGDGTLIIHLGMSGTLQLKMATAPPLPHEHLRISLQNGQVLCYRDPRRFGAIVWTDHPALQHPLLNALGPEPLTTEFGDEYLAAQAATRSIPIKQLIMDNQVVTGIGNIYATEALFAAGIHPHLLANSLTHPELVQLLREIKKILAQAIQNGGTTLRDHTDSRGLPGHFQTQLQIYGKAGQPCPRCQTLFQKTKLGQRTTTFCPQCQPWRGA